MLIIKRRYSIARFPVADLELNRKRPIYTDEKLSQWASRVSNWTEMATLRRISKSELTAKSLEWRIEEVESGSSSFCS